MNFYKSVKAAAICAIAITMSAAVGAKENREAYKIFVTSDVHYLSNSLYDDSETFLDFENSGDGKLIGYSGMITEAFAADVISQKPNAVIISGDLTLNGERKSHEDLSEILGELSKAGIKVLVTPGNHDINNPSAREIKADGIKKTEYVSSEQFSDIYGGCGFDEALSRDEYSLSYISELCDGLYVLMLDTCMYYSNIENNASTTGGKVYDETLDWIEKSIEEVKAKDPNAEFITFAHHNLFVHNKNFELNYVIGRPGRVRERFEKLGLDIIFSGHIHIQDILTQEVNGREITEIVSGALVVYPIAYGVVEVINDELNYYTKWVDIKAYATKMGLEDKNLFNFEQYARNSFNDRSARRAEETLRDNGCPEDDIEEATNTLKMINTNYFAGELELVADDIKKSRGYEVIIENGLSSRYLDSIFESGLGENNKISLRLR